MKKTIYTYILLLWSINSFGQELPAEEQARYSFILQVGYNKGIGSTSIDGLSLGNSGRLYRLRAIGALNVHPKVSLGLGAGMEAYHSPDYNFFPFLIDARYYKNATGNSLFGLAASGYSIKFGDSFDAGMYHNVSIGYRFSKARKTPVLVSAGLDFHQVKDASVFIYDARDASFRYVESTFWLKSLSFNVALLF